MRKDYKEKLLKLKGKYNLLDVVYYFKNKEEIGFKELEFLAEPKFRSIYDEESIVRAWIGEDSVVPKIPEEVKEAIKSLLNDGYSPWGITDDFKHGIIETYEDRVIADWVYKQKVDYDQLYLVCLLVKKDLGK